MALPVTATDMALMAANPTLGPEAAPAATATATYTDWGVRIRRG
jgi:hypothetical protein